MAQLNITLNQEEILHLLCENRDEAFKEMFENCLNSVLKAESEAQLKAAPYERTEDRTDSRNGTRDRDLATRIGKITLHVPRHRNQPFKTMIFENYKRSEAALINCMAEMVVNGVSTRKVSKVIETICGETFSKSSVSEVCKEFDEKVEEFRTRRLTEKYPFLYLDATYFKVRENHRIVSKAFMIAYGVNSHGSREILGFCISPSETKETWNAFLKTLKTRGLHGMLLITSDANEGIRDAIKRVFPGVSWQRCQYHFTKDIMDKVPKKYQIGLRTELNGMFNCRTIENAREWRNSIIDEYQDVAESAMQCLDEGFEDAMTVMILPYHLQKCFRTSNHIERLNREMKRRSKVIGIFPNEASLLRLMGTLLMERHDEEHTQKSMFTLKTYTQMISSEIPEKLAVIAEQQLLQIA